MGILGGFGGGLIRFWVGSEELKSRSGIVISAVTFFVAIALSLIVAEIFRKRFLSTP